MSNSGNIWKERFIWIGGIAAFVVIASISIALIAKDEKLTSYFSAVATGSSIVLATVAIIYSSLERMASRQQVGEMEALIRQASGIIGEKAQIFMGQSAVLEKITESLLTQQPSEQLEQKEQETDEGPSQPTFSFKFSRLNMYMLQVFYLLMKINETKRDIPMPKAIRLCYGEAKQREVSDPGVAAGLFIGSLGSVMGIEGVKVIISAESRRVFVEDLPPTFNEEISKEVGRRLKGEGRWTTTPEMMEAVVRRIDEYFEAD